MKLSIIIATRNRAHALGPCLEHIKTASKFVAVILPAPLGLILAIPAIIYFVIHPRALRDGWLTHLKSEAQELRQRKIVPLAYFSRQKENRNAETHD